LLSSKLKLDHEIIYLGLGLSIMDRPFNEC